MKNCTVFVGGNGRSGTSLVSRILMALGYKTHNSAINYIHEYSPLVYLDDAGALDIDRSLANILAMNEQEDFWFWKSPKDMGYYAKWIYLIRSPRIIIVTRDPKAIAESSSKKEGVPPNIFYSGIANTYGVMAEIITLMPCPVLIVSYDDLLNISVVTIEKIAKFVGSHISDFDYVAQQCVTKGYSDQSGTVLKMSFKDFEDNRRVSFEANFLLIHKHRLSMIDNLLKSVQEMMDFKKFSLENAFLSAELDAFGYTLDGLNFSSVIGIFWSVYETRVAATYPVVGHPTKDDLSISNALTESLLMAVCKLRINAQLYFERLDFLMLK